MQFSTNNGVQWQFLRELDFSSFLEPQVVTIELPSAAKTPYTVFRWWQPQQGGQQENFCIMQPSVCFFIFTVVPPSSQANTRPSGLWTTS